ncbi:hypothetical protein Dsin_028076 [Dipteronia sinensis]|uniref:Uncharacterized protein n=1 Tax=Dipteronia sinensis TaxID=43782 RepID=A0AAE0DU27_9ROSI|nr:hypothetical protein Dsin_028076 [Dipteronia sinensis]
MKGGAAAVVQDTHDCVCGWLVALIVIIPLFDFEVAATDDTDHELLFVPEFEIRGFSLNLMLAGFGSCKQFDALHMFYQMLQPTKLLNFQSIQLVRWAGHDAP